MARNKFLRTCVICRNAKPKKELFRYTIYNNEIVLDFFQKLQNRGFYTCKSLECIKRLNENIVRKNLKLTGEFTFSLENILKITIENLRKEILNHLKIANKSGELVATLNKFLETSEKQIFDTVFLANDISENSYKKVRGYLKDKQVVNIFTKNELGNLFNKEEVNIVGVRQSELGKIIKEKANLLINLLGG